MIYIIGLGAGDETQMSMKVMEACKKYPLYLRTKEHPLIHYLNKNNISYTSFDYLYETHDKFEDVYSNIIDEVIKLGIDDDILYAVPGHPCVAEYTVKELMKTGKAKIIGGQSFLDDLFSSLAIDPIDGLIIMDALSMNIKNLNPNMNLVVAQVFDQMVASDLKLDLMEVYDDEHLVCIVSEVGSKNEKLTWLPLYELDYDFPINNLCSLFVPKVS